MPIDFEIDETGDLALEDADIKIASPLRTDGQLVAFVLQTAVGGLLTSPTLGVRRDFRGTEVSVALLGMIQQEIKRALITTTAFLPDEIIVDVMVVDLNSLFIIVEIERAYEDTDVLEVVFTYNPNFGTITNVVGDNI